MNLELLNPFAQDFPENVEASLDASAVCVRFNQRGLFAGRYIACGRLDGAVTILDFETRGTVRYLEGHVKAVTAVCWSRNGRYLLSASRDWNAIIWDLQSGDRKYTVRFDAPIVSASLHPRNSKLLVVTLHNQEEAVVVDLRDGGGRWELDLTTVAQQDAVAAAQAQGMTEEEATAYVADQEADSKRKEVATIAQFHPSGMHVFVASSQGNIYIFDANSKMLVHTEQVAGASPIKNMQFDFTGSSLVINSNDRTLRVYSIDLTTPVPTLDLHHKFQDAVARTPWTCCGFNKSGDYVLGGAGHKAAHNIYMWDRSRGGLTKILEGPRDPIDDFDWHPVRPIVISVSGQGLIHIWVTAMTENYSAYAPDFETLEENFEYMEREDEFDVEDESLAIQRHKDMQDQIVNILTVEKKGQAEDTTWDTSDHDPDDDLQEDFAPSVDFELEMMGVEDQVAFVPPR